MLKKFTALVFTCAMSLFGYGDTLFWTVDDSATIDGVEGSSLYSFLNSKPYGGEDDIWYGAKVVVKNGSGDRVGTLDVYYQTNLEETNPLYFHYETEPGIDAVDIGHPSEPYGVGAAWNMCPLTQEMMQEYMFMIELGENVWDSLIEDYNWSPLAYSDTVEGQWLKNKYTSENGTIAPPNFNPWTPMNYHTVPEPSTSLLCIIGLGLLLLKRKTNG